MSLTSVQKKIFTIMFVVKSLKGFGWIIVGPASQTVAQHYISSGPMLYGVSGSGMESVTSIMQHSKTRYNNAMLF